ncbi:MAG: hypothetical protein QXE51_03355 [Nitrososphaeria archaeon]
MKLYVEAIEKAVEGNIEPDFIRISVDDVEDLSKAILCVRELLNLPELSGKEFIVQIHYCYHDERKPCKVEPL